MDGNLFTLDANFLSSATSTGVKGMEIKFPEDLVGVAQLIQ